jgi:hypothetical protein
VDACVWAVVGCVEWVWVGVGPKVKGLGDGMEVVPLITGTVVSLEFPTGCNPKRRSAAFEVASRAPEDSRGGSDMVEFVDSESVREPELVSEAEVESEVDVVVGCRTGAAMSCSAG